MIKKFFSKIKDCKQLVRNIKNTYNLINNYEIKRINWLLQYNEEILGGKKSFKEKIPYDKYGKPIPWYTYPLIEFINQLNFSQCTIFEYGSGFSSLYWARNAYEVTSVESDSEWYNIVKSNLMPNQEIILRTEPNDYINEIFNYSNKFDVIIIDGIYRFDCANKAINKLKDGGMLILDNSDWLPNTCDLLHKLGFTQFDFIGPGPINSYAWCTSIFYTGNFNIPRRSHGENIRVLGGLKQTSKYDSPI